MPLVAWLRAFVQRLLLLLWGILIGWLLRFLRLAVRWIRELIEYCRARKQGPREPHMRCIPIPGDVYQRPDPHLYSQSYLMALGIAVTWDNPDIWLELGGVRVPSHGLMPNTDYSVVIQIWNGSFDAPAPGLVVTLAARTFGVNGGLTPIGTTTTNLPVRGAPGHPALARIPWRTPGSGHHCLEATLVWFDDANPLNNVGQENTDIATAAAGQRAAFTIPVTNIRRDAMRLRLVLTGYELPEQPVARKTPPRTIRGTPLPRLRDASRVGRATHGDVDAVIAVNRWNAFPPDPAWSPELSTPELELGPGETRNVEVALRPPAGAAAGERRRVTLVALDDAGRAVGGVTVIAQVA